MINVTIVGKNVDITQAMKERAEKKLAALTKYFKDETLSARLLVKVYDKNQKVEINVETPVGLLRSEVSEDDFYNALDVSVDKLEDQIRRQKTRMSKKHRDKLSVAFLNEIQQLNAPAKEEVVRTKVVVAELMDLSEAIMKMEMLNHDFFIYTDEETEKPAVVYRRFAGGYGLLEIEQE